MSSENDLVELYIQKVDYWLPQPKEMVKQLLENLKEEVIEAIQDKGNPDPVVAYGDPYEVAKGLSLSKDWGLTPARWFTRFMAFTVDILLIVSVCFAYLLFGLVVILGINVQQALTISEISEAFEIFVVI